MELRNLRYFAAVAEELHFRRAAERLHVAQPAVSEQIRKLELELGVQLLNRTNRCVSLTPAGAVLLDDAHRLLRLADDARRAVQNAQAGVTDRLRIGLPPDVLPRAIPRALRRFNTAHPDVAVRIERAEPRAALEAVRADLLDIALVCLPAPVNELGVDPIGEESVVVAMSEWHRNAGQEQFPIEQLDGVEPVVLARAVNPPFHDGLIAAARDAEISTRFVEAPGPTVEQVLLEVADGRSIALLPASVADRHGLSGIRYLPLAEPAPRCTVALVTAKHCERRLVTDFVRLSAAMAQVRGAALHAVKPAIALVA